MAKNEGKVFEEYWKKSVPKDAYYLRIKDSATSFGQDSAFSRFTLSNPYDCFIFYNGFLFPMELKSTKSKSISIQRKGTNGGKMIKYSQIKGLLDANKFNNILSGFVFNFRETDTYWISIDSFMSFLENADKQSINEKDVIEYKGIKIDKLLKRTRYFYGIEDLLNKIIKDVHTYGKNHFL